MNISRRVFVGAGAAGAFGSLLPNWAESLPQSSVGNCWESRLLSDGFSELSATEWCRFPSTFSVTPVVIDGKWIWKDPPAEQRGYLEPREYEYTSGITLRGLGQATQIQATTVAPVAFPEQQILDFKIEAEGCSARVVPLTDGVAQLQLEAPQIVAGQTVSAVARYRLKLFKAYQGYSKGQFPIEQTPERVFDKQFLRDSPGIDVRITLVKRLAAEIVSESMHPWDKAVAFYQWVWDHIQGVPGKYTSVKQAIEDRKGDCEERATVFIALCRAVGIPARLVWIPSHNWAEIGLHDGDGTPHWIPVHTAAYSWFGWTGVHEVVLQKGDRVRLEQRKRTVRLVDDWCRQMGTKPEMHFTSTVTPLAAEPNGDPGPGGRKKLQNGQWELTGYHPDNRYMRDK